MRHTFKIIMGQPFSSTDPHIFAMHVVELLPRLVLFYVKNSTCTTYHKSQMHQSLCINPVLSSTFGCTFQAESSKRSCKEKALRIAVGAVVKVSSGKTKTETSGIVSRRSRSTKLPGTTRKSSDRFV